MLTPDQLDQAKSIYTADSGGITSGTPSSSGISSSQSMTPDQANKWIDSLVAQSKQSQAPAAPAKQPDPIAKDTIASAKDYTSGLGNTYKNAVSDFTDAAGSSKILQNAYEKDPNLHGTDLASAYVGNVLEGGLRATASGVNTVFAPITQAIKTFTDAASGEKGVQAIANNPVVGKILDFFNGAGGHLDSWAEKHPEAAQDLNSAITVAGTAIGGEAEPAVNSAVKTGAEAVKGVATDVVAPAMKSIAENAVQGAKQGIKAIKEAPSVKNDSFVKDLISPSMTTKDMASAIKTGKVQEGEGLTGDRDATGAIPNFDEIQESVKNVPGISPKKTLLENSNAIHDEIGNVAENLKSQLKGKGSFTPQEFKKYMDGVKSDLADSPLIVGDAEKTASKIINKFNNLVEQEGHTPEGLLESRKKLDQWMSNQKGSNIFDPKTDSAISVALKSIRQGGNKFLANLPGVKGVVDVEKSLSHQSNLYSAIENIAPKAAKEGVNGLQQFIKAHPRTIKALKYGTTAIAGGEAVKHFLP